MIGHSVFSSERAMGARNGVANVACERDLEPPDAYATVHSDKREQRDPAETAYLNEASVMRLPSKG